LAGDFAQDFDVTKNCIKISRYVVMLPTIYKQNYKVNNMYVIS